MYVRRPSEFSFGIIAVFDFSLNQILGGTCLKLSYVIRLSLGKLSVNLLQVSGQTD